MRLALFLALTLTAGSASAAAYIKFDGVDGEARATTSSGATAAAPIDVLSKARGGLHVRVEVKKGSKMARALRKGAALRKVRVTGRKGAHEIRLVDVKVHSVKQSKGKVVVVLRAARATDAKGKVVNPKARVSSNPTPHPGPRKVRSVDSNPTPHPGKKGDRVGANPTPHP